MDTGETHKPPPYFLVWVVLFVLTVLEVFYAFAPISKVVIAVGLIVMALWKALLVALYYMHLRWEPKRMWVLAASPIPLIFILLVVVLNEF
jgi:cytochrome c oxidase subunit 4